MDQLESGAGLDAFEERVYGDVVSRIRALEIAEEERKRLIDEVMALVCDAEAAAGTSRGSIVPSDLWNRLATFEEKLG